MLKIEEIKEGEYVLCEGMKQELKIVDVEFSEINGRLLVVVTDGKEEYRRSPKLLVLA